jgi:hypothetical protein
MPQYSLVLLGNEEHSRVVVTDGQDRRQIVRRIGERVAIESTVNYLAWKFARYSAR